MKLTDKNKVFASGNEAIAVGVKLARPDVISAYPITPQTIVVERLSDMVEDKSIDATFMHVESEHSALSSAMGVSAVGARSFTATSSQGLLYMAEVMSYCSGGRFPVVMMNANRALALPWSIFGDQSDSLLLLGSGWIQVYVEDAQEALDMVIQAYKIAEDPKVLTPFMINLDGFVLTHTYELLDIPNQNIVDEFLQKFETPNKMSLKNPKNLGFSTSPADNLEFKYQQHKAMMDSIDVIMDVEKEFTEKFGRDYSGMVEGYKTEDAEEILITVGSITGTARICVDNLRHQRRKVGLVKLRYLRPFPEKELIEKLKNAKVIGVLDKDISFGHQGIVFTEVCSALSNIDCHMTKNVNLTKKSCKCFISEDDHCIKKYNFIAGMGGRNISKNDIYEMFDLMEKSKQGNDIEKIKFINLNCEI